MVTFFSMLRFYDRRIFAIATTSLKASAGRVAILIATGLACLGFFVPSAFGQADPLFPAITAESLSNTLGAAQQGDVQAQVKVGQAYAEGTAGPRNVEEAVKWLQAASSQGSVEADAWLGHMYLLGQGVPRDTSRAANLIQPAAAANNPVGQRFLGVMYETGQGMPRDYAQAAAFYAKAVAQQDANACDRLGLLYLHGLGVKRDPIKAFQLLTQGALLGDRWAQLHLGQMYQGGHVPSASSSNTPSTARTTAGNGKRAARMVFKAVPDYATAMRFYAASAAQRNALAIYKIGTLYENGWGVAQDYAKALEYYQQSAYQRSAPGLIAFARMYELGLGTEANLSYAYLGYSLAAEAGNPVASQHLRLLLNKITTTDVQNGKSLLKAVHQAKVDPGSNGN